MRKTTKFCDICGIPSDEKMVNYSKKFNMFLCKKHMHQFVKFGHNLDTNSRGVFDPNEIRVLDNYCEIDTYDQHGNVLFTYIFDEDNLEEAKKFKWRTALKDNGEKPYLVTGNQTSQKEYFHRLIMGNPVDKEIDHINGNSLDNRKSNLRIINKEDNQLNMDKCKNNKSGFRGVIQIKSNSKWKIDFRYKNVRYYFKQFNKKEEAIYLRYLCEIYFQKEFRFKENDKAIQFEISKLSDMEKNNIEIYFNNKINTLKGGV